MRAGIFGGTLDPIHSGHLAAIEAARERLSLDEVLIVPAGRPRLKAREPEASGLQRLEMARLAAAPYPGVAVSDIEVRRPGATYTVDTLESLAPGRELFLLLGADALRQIALWHRPRSVVQLSRLGVFARPGQPDPGLDALEAVDADARAAVTVIAGPLLHVSSTEVRRRVHEALSIADLVPGPVARYIDDNELYLDGGDTGVKNSAAEILQLALDVGALQFGEFELTSGATSGYYFDGRLVTLDPEGSYRVATALYPTLVECGAEAVAGPTVAADPIVASVATVSHLKGNPIGALIVRPRAKEHGTGRLIEGKVRPGAKVAVVDDTCSTGGSLLHAVDAVEQAGCEVVKVLCILDRRQGGSDEIRRRGYDFAALLEADDDGNIAPASSEGMYR